MIRMMVKQKKKKNDNKHNKTATTKPVTFSEQHNQICGLRYSKELIIEKIDKPNSCSQE